jgi:hypothetical protein
MDSTPRPPEDCCPFLVPVVADRLWLEPLGVYCWRPGQRVRIPGKQTLGAVCATPGHLACGDYQDSVADRTPDAPR